MTIKEQAHDTTTHLAEKMHSAIDKTAESVAQAEERLRKGAAQAAETMHKGSHCAQEKTQETICAIAGYVRENPLLSLGIAFAAGSLIASLTRRR